MRNTNTGVDIFKLASIQIKREGLLYKEGFIDELLDRAEKIRNYIIKQKRNRKNKN